MNQSFNIFLAVFAAMFPIVNPLGGAPIFYQMTAGVTDAVRAEIARKVAVYGFILLLVSMLIGSHILTFFGISLPVLRVAGGLVVTVVGWQLLNQGSATPERATASVDVASLEAQAFYPLTMPITTGPGSIATAVALGAQAGTFSDTSYEAIALHALAAACGLFTISLTVYLAYRYASKLERILGHNGTNILVRLFAFILLCIGMQIMWTGISQLLLSLHGAV